MEFLSAIGTGTQVSELTWNQKCRLEDMAWRQRELQLFEKEEVAMQKEASHMEVQMQWRRQDNERRKVDVRGAEFQQVSSLSALIAGFAMVAMVEVQIPKDLELSIVILYGLATSLTVGCSLIAMLTATFGNILLYKSHREDEVRNQHRVRGDSEWHKSFSYFRWGVTFFLVVMGLTGWITFAPSQHRTTGGVVVSGVAGVFALLWAHLRFKYSDYLMSPAAPKASHAAATLQ